MTMLLRLAWWTGTVNKTVWGVFHEKLQPFLACREAANAAAREILKGLKLRLGEVHAYPGRADDMTTVC